MPLQCMQSEVPVGSRGEQFPVVRRCSELTAATAPEELSQSGARCKSRDGVVRKSNGNTGNARTTRKKADPVKSACGQCKRRKTKCSGRRPVCQSCNERDLECSWDIFDGLSRTADLKGRLEEVTRHVDTLEALIAAMRWGDDQTSTTLLAKLRLGDSLEDIVRSIRAEAAGADITISQHDIADC